MPNLLITGAAKPNKDFLEKLKNIGWDVTLHQSETEAVQNPGIYDAVICNGLFLYNDIKKFTNLKTVQLTSAGLDRVPIEYINSEGIKLFNARGVYSIPMAEWAVCVILNHYKCLSGFYNQQANHDWSKIRNLQELNGKSVAIIGAGNVGSEVAKRLQSFGTNNIGYDIQSFENPYFTQIYKISEFQPDGFDIIILTAPHNTDTHHFISRQTLERFKSGCILINMSRGGLINEEDLINVLTERTDISAILDVFEVEPLAVDSKLWSMQNVKVFPHNSFEGENNEKRLHTLIIKNLNRIC